MNRKPHDIDEGSFVCPHIWPNGIRAPLWVGAFVNITVCLNDVPKSITATVESFVKCW